MALAGDTTTHGLARTSQVMAIDRHLECVQGDGQVVGLIAFS